MNSLHLLLGSALLSLFVVSCETVGPAGSGSSGRVIMYPTVDQMARYEKEWGMEPRQVRPRNSYEGETDYNSVSARTPAPTNSAPPPQPNMLAPAPEPVLDPPQPSVDPATMQKLR